MCEEGSGLELAHLAAQLGYSLRTTCSFFSWGTKARMDFGSGGRKIDELRGQGDRSSERYMTSWQVTTTRSSSFRLRQHGPKAKR